MQFHTCEMQQHNVNNLFPTVFLEKGLFARSWHQFNAVGRNLPVATAAGEVVKKCSLFIYHEGKINVWFIWEAVPLLLKNYVNPWQIIFVDHIDCKITEMLLKALCNLIMILRMHKNNQTAAKWNLWKFTYQVTVIIRPLLLIVSDVTCTVKAER